MWPEGRTALYHRAERSLVVDKKACWDVLGASAVSQKAAVCISAVCYGAFCACLPAQATRDKCFQLADMQSKTGLKYTHWASLARCPNQKY
jgi:hypothetical protein